MEVLVTGFWLVFSLDFGKWFFSSWQLISIIVLVVLFSFNLLFVSGFCFCRMDSWHFGVLIWDNIDFTHLGFILFVII